MTKALKLACERASDLAEKHRAACQKAQELFEAHYGEEPDEDSIFMAWTHYSEAPEPGQELNEMAP